MYNSSIPYISAKLPPPFGLVSPPSTVRPLGEDANLTTLPQTSSGDLDRREIRDVSIRSLSPQSATSPHCLSGSTIETVAKLWREITPLPRPRRPSLIGNVTCSLYSSAIQERQRYMHIKRGALASPAAFGGQLLNTISVLPLAVEEQQRWPLQSSAQSWPTSLSSSPQAAMSTSSPTMGA